MLSATQVSSLALPDGRSYRNGKDITNPRDWYTLLSEKIGCKNGAIEYSHPNDNRFLPQLAHDLDLDSSYAICKSPTVDGGGSTFCRSSISKRSSAYQYESPIKHQTVSLVDLPRMKENTMSTLTSFYCKEDPQFNKKTNRVTFLDVELPGYERSVSLPKLTKKRINGFMPETSVIQNENLVHSHNKNLEEWFSTMPDETTTKAKRTLMEQNIHEKIKRKGPQSIVPLPKVTKPVSCYMDIFPATYTQLWTSTDEEPILIDREIYRLQLKSLLRLKDGSPSMIERMDRKRREYIVVSPMHSENVLVNQTRDCKVRECLSESDTESDFGFDPETCPLFIVSSKRAVPSEMDTSSSQSFKHGSMPRQKKLKRLNNNRRNPRREKQMVYLANESEDAGDAGTTVLGFGDKQYYPLTRQPKHILESIQRQEKKASKGDPVAKERVSDSKDEYHGNNKVALLAAYKKLEVFSEFNPITMDSIKNGDIVELKHVKEIPKLHPPVYKLDRNYVDRTFQCYPGRFEHAVGNVVPLRIENGVVILGSAKHIRSMD